MAPMMLKGGMHRRRRTISGFSILKLAWVCMFLLLKYAAIVYIKTKAFMVGSRKFNESGFGMPSNGLSWFTKSPISIREAMLKPVAKRRVSAKPFILIFRSLIMAMPGMNVK